MVAANTTFASLNVELDGAHSDPVASHAGPAANLRSRRQGGGVIRVMTKPRRILRGAVLIVTMRCPHRRFRLTPSCAVNDLVRYLVAVTATKYHVGVIAMTFQSDARSQLHDVDGVCAAEDDLEDTTEPASLVAEIDSSALDHAATPLLEVVAFEIGRPLAQRRVANL